MYRNLNSHLHNHGDNETSPVLLQMMSTTRKGPRITNDEETIRKNLYRVFGFTNALYQPHAVYFPLQVSVVQRPTILSTNVFIDVNYHWCTEYFHFLTEVLPNVLYLHAKYPNARILCPKSAFTEGMFRWFGVRSDIINRIDRTASRVTAVFAQCGNPSPQAIELIRSVVEAKLMFEKTTGILIRRHKTRFIENEDEVFEQCKQRFPVLNWVIFDMLSPSDTATLFSKAAMIVAPHGAGLTNMIFSSRGISIYEFMPMDEPNICYWHLSEMLGNTYTMIPTPWSDSNGNSMTCVLPDDVR